MMEIFRNHFVYKIPMHIDVYLHENKRVFINIYYYLINVATIYTNTYLFIYMYIIVFISISLSMSKLISPYMYALGYM